MCDQTGQDQYKHRYGDLRQQQLRYSQKDHPSRQPAKWATSVSPMMIRQPLISKSDIRKVMFSPGARSVDPGRLSIALNRYHLTIFIGT